MATTDPRNNAATAQALRHPRRVSAMVPESVYAALLLRSNNEGRSLSNLVAYLLESGAQR